VAQILIRKLDDDLLRRLKMRAKAAGRSAEGEARAVLVSALSRGPVKLGRKKVVMAGRDPAISYSAASLARSDLRPRRRTSFKNRPV
jgi:plasmid stability protein